MSVNGKLVMVEMAMTMDFNETIGTSKPTMVHSESGDVMARLRENCSSVGGILFCGGILLYLLSGNFLDSINFSTQRIGGFMALASIFMIPDRL